MKLFLALLGLMGAYLYLMFHTTDVVLQQTQQLSASYQRAARYGDQIAAQQ